MAKHSKQRPGAKWRARQRRALIVWIAGVSALTIALRDEPLAGFNQGRALASAQAQSAGPSTWSEPGSRRGPSRPAPILLEQARVSVGLEQRGSQMREAREAFLKQASDWQA